LIICRPTGQLLQLVDGSESDKHRPLSTSLLLTTNGASIARTHSSLSISCSSATVLS
jgi:hypothetical protein